MSAFDLADFLGETREHIEESGWLQQSFRDDAGFVCSIGGMLGVLNLDPNGIYDPRVLAGCTALATSLGLLTHHKEICTRQEVCTCVLNWIMAWNDDESQTMERVLDAFAKAEKIERAGFDPDAA